MAIQVTVPDGIAKVADVFCGCGSPCDAWVEVHKELKRCGTEGDAKQAPNDSGLWYIMAYLLDHSGLTEHGTSIRWAWLTADGAAALAFLDEWGSEWPEHESADFVRKDGVVIGGSCLR